METVANSRVNGDGKLAAIFSRARDAEAAASKWNGDQPPMRKAYIDLSDAEIESLLGRKQLPQLRPITNRPLQLSHTASGTNPAA